MFFRTGWNYDVAEVSKETAFDNTEPSLTVQSERDDADINVLVERFGLVGRMPENPKVPMYGDFTGATDYRSALEAVREADANFMELPPSVRERFANDPQQLLEFCADNNNYEEARKLGLLKADIPEPVPSPTPAPPVPPST